MYAKYEQYAHVAYTFPFLMASSALDILRRLFVFNDSMWCIKAARELQYRHIRLYNYIQV